MLRIICPKCQCEQDESKECLRCGLIFKRYREAETFDDEKPGWRLSFRTIRLFLLVPTVLILLLITWPQRTLPSEPDPEAPARMQMKIAETQEIVGKGEAHQLKLDEWEVNSWLDENLTQAMTETQAQIGEEWAKHGTVDSLVVAFEEDRIQVHLQFQVLSKDMALTLWGRVRTVDGYLRMDVDSGAMGQLPLPRSVLQRAMSNVFDSPENMEKFQLPPGIGDIRLENGQLVVDYLASSSEEIL